MVSTLIWMYHVIERIALVDHSDLRYAVWIIGVSRVLQDLAPKVFPPHLIKHLLSPFIEWLKCWILEYLDACLFIIIESYGATSSGAQMHLCGANKNGYREQ